MLNLFLLISQIIQSAEAVDSTNCNSAKGLDPSPPTKECHGYNTKQSDGEAPVMLELLTFKLSAN